MPGDDPDAPGRLTAHPAADAERLRGELDHYDRSQLWFQVQEIVADRCYLGHGVAVGPGDVVLDVGANVGVAAAFFASVCGASTVYSFEPVPSSFALLERNVAGLPACRCHPFGLGRSAERFEFSRIDLLKIDVEQAEADVLAGILDADWPLIRQVAAEVHDLDGRLAAIVSELRGRGFEVETEQEPAFRDGPLHMLYAIR